MNVLMKKECRYVYKNLHLNKLCIGVSWCFRSFIFLFFDASHRICILCLFLSKCLEGFMTLVSDASHQCVSTTVPSVNAKATTDDSDINETLRAVKINKNVLTNFIRDEKNFLRARL